MASDPSSATHAYHIIPHNLASEDPFGPIFLENPNLPKFIDHSEKTRYWYKPWEGSMKKFYFQNLYVLLDNHVRRPGGGVVIIEEAGNQAISVLKKVFPDLDLEFVHRHVARSVSEGAEAVRLTVAHDIEIQPLSRGSGEPGYSYGLHFDGRCVPPSIGDRYDESKGSTDLVLSFMERPIPFGRGYRSETLVKHGEIWHTASTRISCCLLGSGLYLLLIDKPLHVPSINIRDPAETPMFPMLPKDPYDRPEWKGFGAYETLLRTFKNFPPREVLELMSPKIPPTEPNGTMFHYLLSVSDWQSIIEDLEHDMRRLQSQATESLDKKMLEALGAFRRILAAARVSIANNEKQMLLATGMATVGSVGRQKSHGNVTVINNLAPGARLEFNGETKFGQADPEQSDTEAIDAATLLERLAQLEDRLGVIAKTVNEEIQLFIASVSIRDSEVMLADSKS